MSLSAEPSVDREFDVELTVEIVELTPLPLKISDDANAKNSSVFCLYCRVSALGLERLNLR